MFYTPVQQGALWIPSPQSVWFKVVHLKQHKPKLRLRSHLEDSTGPPGKWASKLGRVDLRFPPADSDLSIPPPLFFLTFSGTKFIQIPW